MQRLILEDIPSFLDELGEGYCFIRNEYKIKINNEQKREEIIKVLSTFDWKEYLNCIAMRKIQQFHIVDVLKQNVEGIK